MVTRDLDAKVAVVAFLVFCMMVAFVSFMALRSVWEDSERVQASEQTGLGDVAEARNLWDRAEIGRDEAEEAAINEVAGQIVDTSLDDENSRVVYAVEILGDGALHEITVDASNAEILAHGTEDQDDAEYQDGSDD